jgi:hypothetical protein
LQPILPKSDRLLAQIFSNNYQPEKYLSLFLPLPHIQIDLIPQKRATQTGTSHVLDDVESQHRADGKREGNGLKQVRWMTGLLGVIMFLSGSGSLDQYTNESGWSRDRHSNDHPSQCRNGF